MKLSKKEAQELFREDAQDPAVVNMDNYDAAINYMGEHKKVKVRKDFLCHKCRVSFSKGSYSVNVTMVDGTDFFTLKYCEECHGNK